MSLEMVNLIPDKYPNIYSTDINRWVDEEYYTIYHPKAESMERRYDQMKIKNFEQEFLLVVLSDEFSVTDKNAVLAIEIGTKKGDVIIHNIEIIGFVDSEPDFDLNNEAARVITQDEITYPYQEFERFYGGFQNRMTSIKDMVMDISMHEWYNNPDMEWF